MCFTISKLKPNELKAKFDIPCWKVYDFCNRTYDHGNHLQQNGFRSEHRKFRYKFGAAYEGELQPHDDGSSISIGFHSFTSYNEARRYADGMQVVVLCYIPKGSRFYHNPERDGLQYCSNNIGITYRTNKKAKLSLLEKLIVFLNRFEWFFTH